MDNPGDEIARIRQILIGHNVSEIEKRIGQNEHQFKSLLDDFALRLSLLDENFTALQRQLEQLNMSIQEKDKRIEQLEQTLVQRIAATDSRIGEETGLIKQFFADSIENTMNLLSQKAEQQNNALIQLRNQIDEKLHLLQSSKVDRYAMALLLNDLALQLSGASPESTQQTTSDNE